MEKLYCTHCEKWFDVPETAIRLMRENGYELPKDTKGYRFEAGCFFKILAQLKRKQKLTIL